MCAVIVIGGTSSYKVIQMMQQVGREMAVNQDPFHHIGDRIKNKRKTEQRPNGRAKST